MLSIYLHGVCSCFHSELSSCDRVYVVLSVFQTVAGCTTNHIDTVITHNASDCCRMYKNHIDTIITRHFKCHMYCDNFIFIKLPMHTHHIKTIKEDWTLNVAF